MRIAFRVALIITLPLGVSMKASGQGSPPPQSRDSVRTALVRELLTMTHAIDQAVAVMEAAVPAQRAANPRIPAVFWDRFLAQARAQRTDLEMMISASYERHFSSDDLRQLLAFYRTPIGQKTLSVLPVVMQESMQAGQEWGQRLGASVGAQLEAEGVRIKP